MTREEISQAVGDIRDEYIEEAAQMQACRKKHRRKSIRFLLGAAACIAVAVAVQGVFPRMISGNETVAGSTSYAQVEDTAPMEGGQENAASAQSPQQASVLRVRIETRSETGFTAAVLSETAPFRTGDVVEITVQDTGADKQEDTAQEDSQRAAICARYPQALEKAAEGDIIEIEFSQNEDAEKTLCIMLKKDA